MFDRPGRSMACQAHAAAVLTVALSEAGRDRPLTNAPADKPAVLKAPDKWTEFHARVTRARAAEHEALAPAPQRARPGADSVRCPPTR